MAMTVGELTAYLDVDDRKYNTKVDAAGKRFGGLGSIVTSTGAKIASGLAAAGIASFVKSSISSASDLNESLSKTQVVFGAAGGAMVKWAASSATAMGMSKQAALEAVSTYGNLFQAMDIGKKPAQDMSKGLVELAADLASFNNIDPAEALEKLRAGIVGETEPLRTLGVNLSAATVQAEAYRMGLAKQGTELTAAQKAQASYSLIMEQTKTAQGDFARTSDGLANKQRILKANFTNLSASLGTALLPAMTSLVGVVTTAFAGFNKLPGPVKTVVVALGGITVAAALIAPFASSIIAVVTAMKTWAIVSKATAAAQWLLNIAMTANPIGLVIVAIAAFVAALVIAYKRVGWFRAFVDAAFKYVTKVVLGAFNAVAGAARWAVDQIRKHWRLIVTVLAGPIAGALLLFVKFRAKMVEAGRQIVVGLWEGIQSMAGWIWDKVSGFAGGIYDAVKRGLGKLWPFSPSVAGVELGYFLALGIEKGIQTGMPVVRRAVAGLNAQMQFAGGGSPQLALAGAGTRSGAVYSITIDARGSLFGSDTEQAVYEMVARAETLANQRDARNKGLMMR